MNDLEETVREGNEFYRGKVQKLAEFNKKYEFQQKENKMTNKTKGPVKYTLTVESWGEGECGQKFSTSIA